MPRTDAMISKDELLAKIPGYDAVISLLTEDITKEVIQAGGKNLKIIANYAVGYNNIDVKSATQAGVWVSNTPDVPTDSTADMTWALLFSIARRTVEADKYVRMGKYKGWSATMLLGGDIYGKTLGIIGAGRIGAATGMRASGFQMRILYVDIYPCKELDDIGAKRVEIDECLRESDFVSLNVPLLPSTHHLISKKSFEIMKQTAYLINTSRGPVVDEAALVEALKAKKIAGAALDVFEDEPKLAPGLADLDNVVLAPHIGSASIDSREKMSTMAAQNVISVLKGGRPLNPVNDIPASTFSAKL
eukprot:TRINITY_DN782_c0_g1_i2.p1 TRINITY_DN782_c0_g1~~TRINITY_DN782_c0_g1_i2.p1  ORF type:complete len:304 (+),score=50.12 TRINITY_DN782_c0_g1_i2:107-1018(+)